MGGKFVLCMTGSSICSFISGFAKSIQVSLISAALAVIFWSVGLYFGRKRLNS